MSNLDNRKIIVKYNNTELNPTPLVNYSKAPINFGYVYGYNTDITLEGFYSGIAGTNGTGTAISALTTIFANQFKILSVDTDTTINLYKWDNVTVDSISIDPSTYFSGSFVKYSIKLKSYDFPSGVIDPSNEYSFTQNDDGTVNVNHKISARGVRNSVGAFANAIAFVSSFTGKDPYTNCAPFFVPNGKGALLSTSENINRAEGIYSVNEVYKYTTGENLAYFHTTNLSIDESLDSEYKRINYNLKVQGSPVDKNLSAVISSLDYNLLSDIGTEFGLDTSRWWKDSYSATVDSGTAAVDIKVGYISGSSSVLANGFLDYDVTWDYDRLTNTEIWKVNGEFKCFGPLEYKRYQLNTFKTDNNINYVGGNDAFRPYLSGLITSSPIYTSLHDSSNRLSYNSKVVVNENQNLATLKLSLEVIASYEPAGVSDLKYTIDGTPSRWVYELLPSANIEGAFVIQDLQLKTQPKQSFNISAKASDKKAVSSAVYGYMNNLNSTYITSGTDDNVQSFLTDESLRTGIYDVSLSREFLGNGKTTIDDTLLKLKAVATYGNTVETRKAGYKFGY
jgi:hypothetical protein